MNVKHGFSTLNRLLGKKNKGHHLSKSTTNLNSISSHNNQIDTSSLSSHHNNHNHQLEQNRITPLPIATTNAPFEQTFRITVLLPKGQLYVARLGAKTKLQKLLEIVCENKQLDQERYEFRHPVDSSQVFSCELTIGAVGLNEIRLCHKSEAYDNFNADEIIKLRHTGRDSLSSSEFSSRNSKHTLKTASPYSSTNSLNSIDSTGMSTNYRGQIVSLPSVPNTMRSFVPKPPPVAPARKKRIAPRPPSQNSIPEKEPVNGNDENNSNKCEHSIYKKEFHVSSPNLMSQSIEFTSLRSKDFHKSNLSVDCNGNTSNRENNNTTNIIVKVNKEKNIPNGNLSNGHLSIPRNDIQSYSNSNEKETKNIKARPVSISAIGDEIIKNEVDNGFDFTRNQTLEEKNDRRSSTSTMNGSTETLKVPEPTPRKKIITNKKKAPAPPPRVLQCPIALPRNATETTEISTIKSKENIVDTEKPKSNGILPQGVHQNEMESTKTSKWNDIESKENAKVLLQNNVENEIRHHINGNAVDQSPNLQNDIQISTSENHSIESSQSYLKPTFESSSDEEEHIKVYNLKLGKTIVKPLVEHKTYEDLTAISSLNDESTHTEDAKIQEMHSTRSESPEWSYTIPAPPNFADDNSTKAHLPKTNSSNISDSSIPSPITEVKIDQKQETVLENLSKVESATEIITSDIEDGYRGGKDQIECQENESIIQNKNLEKDSNDNSLKFDENINSSRSDVMVELNNILNENRLEEVISRSVDDREKIESSKPSSLSNFKISTYSTNAESEKENEYDSVQDNQTRKNSDTEEKPKNSSLKEDDIRESQEQNISHENYEKYFVEDIKESSSNEKDSITSVLKLEKEESCILKNETTFLHESDSVNQYQAEEKISMQYENNNEGNANTDRQQLESSTKIKNDISSHIEDERLFKKRSNVNSNCTTPHIFKSRISITRSDSFHSTQHPNNMSTDNSGGISVRSSSYISLFNAKIAEQNKTNLNQPFKDTRHRKSSSELSIGESPSLQSLIVMKSILNSRKNSFNTEEDAQNRLISNKIHNENSFRQETKLLYNDCDSSKENSPKNKILSQEEKIVERIDRQEEPEKKWKYQGPPSINLTSWNERPKIQVSIKNDDDYKFGVGGGGIGGNTSITTFPRVYRNAVTTNSTQHQQQKIDTSPVRIVSEQPKVPFVRGVEYKKPLTSIDVSKSIGESNSIVYIKPLDSDATINSTMSNTMTLGRMPKINRNANFVPTVRGFRNSTPVTVENGFYSLKTDSIHETSNKNSENEKYMNSQNSLSQQKFNLQTWKNSSNNLGRSNSIVSTYPSKYSTPSPYINQNNQNNINGTFSNKNSEENPFSKVVLRKTGLKEKIMSTSNKLETPPKPIKMDNSNCAKLELKLTTTVSQNSKPTPPPLPPVIRSVITKQNTNNYQNCGIGNSKKLENGDCIQEPRNALLSAIRNFNRETLKRS